MQNGLWCWVNKMNYEEYTNHNNSVYMNCLNKNTDNHLAVNWGSKTSQQKRFEILMEVNKDFNTSSIIDVGCGLGHFADFLKSRDFQGIYQGTDILNEMVENAQKRNPNLKFRKENLFECSNNAYDYVVMSGIFTFGNINIFQNMIIESYRVCKKGLAFNSLSSWATKKEDGEFYADPIKTLEFCSKITSKVVLRHDYLPHDFTIYMYK